MSARAALLALCLLAPPWPARAEEAVRVIVHPANPVASLTRAQVSALFLKKTARWPNGTAARPVEPRDEGLQGAFAQSVHGRNVSAIRAYWNQQIFSGRNVPPETGTEAQVIRRVSEDPAALGYVSAATAPAGVKILRIED